MKTFNFSIQNSAESDMLRYDQQKIKEKSMIIMYSSNEVEHIMKRNLKETNLLINLSKYRYDCDNSIRFI